MLLSITGTIVSFILFGFSENFVWAVCAWLLWGLLDGVMKTYLSEVCNPCVVKWIIIIVMECIIVTPCAFKYVIVYCMASMIFHCYPLCVMKFVIVRKTFRHCYCFSFQAVCSIKVNECEFLKSIFWVHGMKLMFFM